MISFSLHNIIVNMEYIKRDIESLIIESVSSFSSIALTGPRQSGKSTLLRNLLNDYKYQTLDDPIYRTQAITDPNLFLDNLGQKAIIDEIQFAPELLSYIKMKIDENRDLKGQFALTGSQQFHLIKNLGDSLAGRIALLELLPFSINEYKRAKGEQKLIDIFINAALKSMFPEPLLNDNINPTRWFSSYIQTYLERDIRTIYNIGNIRDFQRFMILLASRIGQVLNMNNLANDLGISAPTVKNWISILEACRIIYLLQPYYNNFGKRITKSPKIYFLDIGLVCYLTGMKEKEHILQGPLSGQLFENFCIQEIVKHFLNRGEKPPIYFLRTNNNLEIDLIVEKNLFEIIPIEIKLTKTPTTEMVSPIKRLKDIFDKLSIKEGYLVNLSDKKIKISADVMSVGLEDLLTSLNL